MRINLKTTMLYTAASLFLFSCSKKDDPIPDPTFVDFGYHAHIEMPTTDDKHIGDVLHMEVEFESHTGQPVHNVRVKVYKKTDKSVVVYEGPNPVTVNAVSGSYSFHEHIDITEDNGFSAHSDWIMEAAVWGPTTIDGPVVEKVEFHVHPM